MSLLSNFFYKNEVDTTEKMKDFIFYKIIDFDKRSNQYYLQCTNTSQVFRSSLIEIITDQDLLYSLHPWQACFIGIEYTKFLKQSKDNCLLSNKDSIQKQKLCTQSRYGNYCISYYKKDGYFSVFCKESAEEFIESAYKLAFSKELLQEFDAIDAFYIGQEAAKIMMNLSEFKEPNNVHFLKLDK